MNESGAHNYESVPLRIYSIQSRVTTLLDAEGFSIGPGSDTFMDVFNDLRIEGHIKIYLSCATASLTERARKILMSIYDRVNKTTYWGDNDDAKCYWTKKQVLEELVAIRVLTSISIQAESSQVAADPAVSDHSGDSEATSDRDQAAYTSRSVSQRSLRLHVVSPSTVASDHEDGNSLRSQRSTQSPTTKFRDRIHEALRILDEEADKASAIGWEEGAPVTEISRVMECMKRRLETVIEILYGALN
ncbi:hypothetical protein EW146_g2483 [Bondarzewia mesenterica]|uniref:Uncharacterized protein n=1 Tax=Bondarzewia mesenterica TaxID=1095465 RepID=A0A4S4M0S1_9AGAM|nr:hypothetical protein EW146_g2483 [Bondarzewia mesenterica]